MTLQELCMTMLRQQSNTASNLFSTTVAFTVAIASFCFYKQFQKTKRPGANKEKDEDLPIYLDYNGTTPIRPEVTTAMIPYLSTHFGNPSSTHYYGIKPKMAIQKARSSVASLFGGSKDGVIFTGCGTEADNLAIHLALESFRCRNMKEVTNTSSSKIPHVVTSSVEHPAILEYLKNLQIQNKIDVTFLPVSSDCQISPSQVEEAIRPDQTCLVTIMFAQNEIGSLMPVREIIQICKQNNILFHTDAAQAVGKINMIEYFGGVQKQKEMILPDMITIVGHKFGAPKGIASLYIDPSNTNSKVMLSSLASASSSSWGKAGGTLIGGGQELGRRAGTENVPYIVGMGKAADLVMEQIHRNPLHLERLRTQLLLNLIELLELNDENEEDSMDGIKDGIKDDIKDGIIDDNEDDIIDDNEDDNDVLEEPILQVHGPSDPTQRLPNTLSIGIRDIHAGNLLKKLGDRDVAASAGSACHSTSCDSSDAPVKVSSVLKEMGVPMKYAMGTLRLSVGVGTTEEDVQEAATLIAREAKILGQRV